MPVISALGRLREEHGGQPVLHSETLSQNKQIRKQTHFLSKIRGNLLLEVIEMFRSKCLRLR
jgi:hypothetical protein